MALPSKISDEAMDEVKVFRSTDPSDDADDIASNSAELADDKKDLALQAEIESQTDSLGPANPLLFNQNLLSSPSFPFFAPYSHLFAPISPYAAAMAAQAYNNLHALNVAAAAFAAHSPRFMQQFGAAPTLNADFRSPFANGLVGMGVPKAPNTAPPKPGHLNSPSMMSMANGLGGISISADRKMKRDNERRQRCAMTSSSEHRTPKRDKREHEGERVKKPMNAYMIFMKENRERFLQEFNNQDGKRIQSADLNKMMGEVWQKMDRAEQEPYYGKARTLREEHQRQHPNWTARDNYAINKKNKKKRREKSLDTIGEQKKCRARYGVDNQEKWCKHCKRKKRCLNVRDADSPVVSSTTNPTTPSSSSSIPQHGGQMPQLGLGGHMGGFNGLYQDMPSCSSSSMTTGSSSVGKRSESARSSSSSSNSSEVGDETLIQQHENTSPISSQQQHLEAKVFDQMEMPKPTPTHTLMDLSVPSAFQFNASTAFNNPFSSLMMMNGAGHVVPNFAQIDPNNFGMKQMTPNDPNNFGMN